MGNQGGGMWWVGNTYHARRCLSVRVEKRHFLWVQKETHSRNRAFERPVNGKKRLLRAVLKRHVQLAVQRTPTRVDEKW